MALQTYNITFTPAPGSLGTQVDVRKDGETTWITPSTPPNPTTLSTYPVTLDDTFGWSVRVSAVGLNCPPRYKYATIPAGTAGDTLIWIENTYTCEQEDPLTTVATYTGFSSPLILCTSFKVRTITLPVFAII